VILKPFQRAVDGQLDQDLGGNEQIFGVTLNTAAGFGRPTGNADEIIAERGV
jgi:hypothetical protein